MNILLVDDDERSRLGVAKFLSELGHQVTECRDGDEAYNTYTAGEFPMVLSDIRMPKMSGIELLSRIAALTDKRTDVVLFTGHGDISTAIQALRAGAYDYLLKPINVEELADITDKIAEHQSLLNENKVLVERFSDEVQAATEDARREVARLKQALEPTTGLERLVFSSPQMKAIVLQAQKYHDNRAIPVLIEGETGTGKEIIARMIHYGYSAGEQGIASPFIDVNCAAITASLFESELFGYESGAFTGSLTKGQKGKFDIAQGGTLLLDEVGEIPLELQGKLLRVIQEKEFYRVGGLKKIKTDVRIVCATNADLEQRVEQGAFRRDLYFRIKVGNFLIPPPFVSGVRTLFPWRNCFSGSLPINGRIASERLAMKQPKCCWLIIGREMCENSETPWSGYLLCMTMWNLKQAIWQNSAKICLFCRFQPISARVFSRKVFLCQTAALIWKNI